MCEHFLPSSMYRVPGRQGAQGGTEERGGRMGGASVRARGVRADGKARSTRPCAPSSRPPTSFIGTTTCPTGHCGIHRRSTRASCCTLPRKRSGITFRGGRQTVCSSPLRGPRVASLLRAESRPELIALSSHQQPVQHVFLVSPQARAEHERDQQGVAGVSCFFACSKERKEGSHRAGDPKVGADA